MPIYRRLRRSRVRMVLEAAEDRLRGFDTGQTPMTTQRVTRDRLAIEHLLPQQWEPTGRSVPTPRPRHNAARACT